MKNKNERGAEIVEFALVLPFLILMCLGVIEFGRIYYAYNILTKAVRDGARYAATSRIRSDGTFSSTIVARTRRLVVFGNVNGSGSRILPNLQTTQVNVTPLTSGGQQYVTVGVAYPYSPLFSLIIPTSLTLRPSLRMQFVGQVIF
jgi:Flp pilus assembly protein TadG